MGLLRQGDVRILSAGAAAAGRRSFRVVLCAFFRVADVEDLERTEDVLDRVTKVLMAGPSVRDVISIGDFSLLTGMNASNMAAATARTSLMGSTSRILER